MKNKVKSNNGLIIKIPDVSFDSRNGMAYQRVRINGKDTKISLNVKIGKSPIEPKTGIVSGNPIATQLILAYHGRFKTAYKDCILAGKEPNIDYLKSEMFGRVKKEIVPIMSVTLERYFEHSYGKSSVLDSKTVQKNGYMLRYVNEWLKCEFHGIRVELIDIKPIHAEKLMNWVISVRKVEKEHGRRCVGFMDRTLKFAVDSGWLVQNPFQYVLSEKKFQRQTKEIVKFLTETELKKIENIHIKNPDIARIRDWFVLACHIGTAWDTFPIIKKSWIKIDESGTKYIDGQRGKPNKEKHEPFIVPLNDKAKQLIERFLFESLPHSNFLLNKIPTGQHVNLMLKEIALLAGVEKSLSFNYCRKTFATIHINNGTRAEIIQKMMGHTNIKSTLRHYAKIEIQTILSEGLYNSKPRK